MSFKTHPDYAHELVRLDYTMDFLEEVIAATEQKRSVFWEDIKEAYKSLDPSDSSLSYTNIMVGSSLLDQLEKNYLNYIKIRKKPYFARIDIRQKEEEKIEKLYIGKASLFTNAMEPVIIDWRAPVVNVYYDGRLGHITYQTDVGEMSAELSLKRQFMINNGIIENMMDIDITAKDTFLQASLAGNANDRLKEIASTIQAEQNAIIRADMNKTLVVQGVAGSGKTTIALHRIAYLIYTYEKQFDPDQFMIIAPNRLFLDYISEVLPELGVEKVKQTTYVDFVMEVIGQKLKMTSPDEKLNHMIEHREDPLYLKNATRAAFKGSLRFRDIINRYVDDLEQTFMPQSDFYVGKLPIVSKDVISHVFLKEYHFPPFHKRLTQIKTLLKSYMKEKVKVWVQKIEAKCDQEVLKLKNLEMDIEDRRALVIELMDRRDSVIDRMNKDAQTAVNKYMHQCPNKKLLEYYYDLMAQPHVLEKYGGDLLTREEIEEICQHTEYNKGLKQVDHEDLAPLIYLHYKIFGLSEKSEIKYVVMDEAQDFSLFEFYTLKSILNTERFSILGDMSQGIHAYRAVQNWEDVLTLVFNKERSTYLTLEQSYRTTVEIMALANTVIAKCPIPNLILAKPVLRHGEVPVIKRIKAQSDKIKATVETIYELRAAGYHSIAIIGKSMSECILIEKALKAYPEIEFLRINGKDQTYAHHLVIVPSHLAKGLEFDGVILLNLEAYFDETPLDLKLLYVSMTRALHRLTWIY